MTIDIDKIDFSYPGFSFGYESFGLGEFIKALNAHMSKVQDQYRLLAKKQLDIESEKLDQYEYSDALNNIDEVADIEIPRYFRISALVTIWGLFESFVIDIADYVKRRKEIRCSFRDIRPQNYFWKTTEIYFEDVLDVKIPWSGEEKAKLGQLQELRNIIAHSNGRLIDMPQEKKNKIFSLVKGIDGVEASISKISISSKYIDEAKELIFNCIGNLSKYVADMYDGPIIP